MKILNAEQIRAWDQYTIEHEPIASIDLMERAASKCVEWLEVNGYSKKKFTVFCGVGNNGGDGLAIARKLFLNGYKVSVYILALVHKGSADFEINRKILHDFPGLDINYIQNENNFPELKDVVIIDALFGAGLSRPLEGITAKLVDHINKSSCEVISIDIPSGMYVDSSSKGNPIDRRCPRVAAFESAGRCQTGRPYPAPSCVQRLSIAYRSRRCRA